RGEQPGDERRSEEQARRGALGTTKHGASPDGARRTRVRAAVAAVARQGPPTIRAFPEASRLRAGRKACNRGGRARPAHATEARGVPRGARAALAAPFAPGMDRAAREVDHAAMTRLRDLAGAVLLALPAAFLCAGCGSKDQGAAPASVPAADTV